jgi:hypothetical protein
MLEKTLGVTLVTKLRAILLMEANFNASNKIIYGTRMMAQARNQCLVFEENYRKEENMADNGTLKKTLFYDITCEARVSAAIAWVDASICYDRIARKIASLEGVHRLVFWKHKNIKKYVSLQQIPGKYSTLSTVTKCKTYLVLHIPFAPR